MNSLGSPFAQGEGRNPPRSHRSASRLDQSYSDWVETLAGRRTPGWVPWRQTCSAWMPTAKRLWCCETSCRLGQSYHPGREKQKYCDELQPVFRKDMEHILVGHFKPDKSSYLPRNNVLIINFVNEFHLSNCWNHRTSVSVEKLTYQKLFAENERTQCQPVTFNESKSLN